MHAFSIKKALVGLLVGAALSVPAIDVVAQEWVAVGLSNVATGGGSGGTATRGNVDTGGLTGNEVAMGDNVGDVNIVGESTSTSNHSRASANGRGGSAVPNPAGVTTIPGFYVP